MMENDTWNSTSTSSSHCPHSYEKGVPICWDCAEEGHVSSSQGGESAANSPAWQRLRRFRKSMGFWDASLRDNSVYNAGSPVSTLEIRPPEEGLEVAASGDRRSQPGLIVVTGPQVVSAEDKYLQPEPPKTWAAETISKEESLRSSFPISPVESEPEEQRIWGFRRRTFWMLVAIAIVALLGLIIGIAVGVSKHKNAHSTSLAPIDEDQVSSIPPPKSSTGITITETVSLSVASRSSTLITLLKTETPSSSASRQKPKPTMTTAATTGGRGGEGGGGGGDAETAPVIATVFVTQPPPSPTDTIRSQPTVSNTPSPKETSHPAASPSPTPSGPSSRICIGDDGSTYTDPGRGDKFRLECGASHQGQDIENVKADSMQACIGLCAKNTHCKGAVWYNVGPQGTNLNYCWLKSAMEDPKKDGAVLVTQDAQSVVRL